MLIDANCDDSVTIPRCPNLDLKVSVALKKTFAHLRAHFGHPPISDPDPPLNLFRTGALVQVPRVPVIVSVVQ